MKSKYSFLIVFVLILLGCNKIKAQEIDWMAPAYTNTIENPFKNDPNAYKGGKEIFEQMCVLCHGLSGKGNGEAGLTLERKPANFLALNIINEPDGAIFWKLTTGKAPMASYRELLTDDQRWKLVNYIRVLGKKIRK